MSTEYTIVIEKDEDGYYVGSVPDLLGCHTQGKSIDQLLERMEEAITLWLEVKGEDAPRMTCDVELAIEPVFSGRHLDLY